MSSPAEPILWQFSLSTVNAIVWVALLLLALGMGLRMRWGRLVAVTAFLTLDLLAFGAFVRLTDSGLGCPDWPGCYGQLLPTQATSQINEAIAEQGGTHGPVSHGKAWIEMLHRYVASFIGALILVMLLRALLPVAVLRRLQPRDTGLRFRGEERPVGWRWPLLLLVVVSLQGLFGKWTVTLKLMPAIVTTHLMGGMLLFSLLVWFWMRERERSNDSDAMAVTVAGPLRSILWFAIAALAVQIFLGGWVSTNYAVLACGGFPACNGSFTPDVAWRDGFAMARELGRNPDGSFLSAEALRAIHWAHRIGALVVSLIIVFAAVKLMRAHAALRRQALWIKLALLAQILIGISTVVLARPLLIATAHNFFAAVLLATLLIAAYRVRTAGGNS